MKAKNFFIVFLLVSLTAFAQQINVPTKTKDSFSKLYPKAADVKWDKEKNNYEASFKQDGKDMSVIFDKDGKVLETETAIEVSKLPKEVEKYVVEKYNGYKITEAEKIVKANGEKLFEVEVTKGKNTKDLLFDSNGKPEKKDINKMREEDNEDEDENEDED